MQDKDDSIYPAPGEAGGYTRLQGYERFDGQPKPSEATFILIPFDAGTNEPDVDDLVTGSVSAYTGVVAGYTVTSGDWSTNDAVGLLALHATTGTFVDNEIFTNTTQTNTCCTQNGAQEPQGAPTDALYDSWLQASIEWRRGEIDAVPGEGDILGVWQYNGTKYAFRNNVGSTAAVMHESTSSGWSAVDLGQTMAFTAGSTIDPVVGLTITGGTSGATGVISGYSISSGTFGANSAAGNIYFHTLTGTFQAAENVTYTGGSFTATAASTNTTLTAGGKYANLGNPIKRSA